MKRLLLLWLVAAGSLILVAGVWAAAPPAVSDQAAKTTLTPSGGEVKVCQVLCRLKCRNGFKRRKCRPGSRCRWRVPVRWRCVYLRGICHPQFRVRIIWTPCFRQGWCGVKYQLCRCGR